MGRVVALAVHVPPSSVASTSAPSTLTTTLVATESAGTPVNVPVIASGGAGEMRHFYDVLTAGKADAVLAASVFHYGQFTVRQVKDYLRSRQVEVRY